MSNEPEVQQDGVAETPEQKADRAEALQSMGATLAGKQGKALWSSFEELANTPQFQQWIEDEVPNRAALLNVDRRKFLQLGASALALAGLSGCRIMPPTRAVPYVRSPEELVPSVPLAYATAVARGGYATGIVVECHEGRPIKVEGNPRHPASLGNTFAWEQAEILNMYDPERSQTVRVRQAPGNPQDVVEAASWDQALAAIRSHLVDRAAQNGAGLALLTENITSPTLNAQIQRFRQNFRQARWVQYEPINRDHVYEGTRLAFGRPLNPIYRLRGARVIVALDADFFTELPGGLRYSREFAEGRKVRRSNPRMNRLYAIEASYSLPGVVADHREKVKPSEVEQVARALYAAVSGGTVQPPAGIPVAWMEAMVRDLQANAGAAVVIPGEHTTPATQALCHAVNAALGAIGTTVTFTEPVEAEVSPQLAGLKALAADMEAGRIQTLIILGGNPVYNAPADLNFATAMDKVALRVHLSQSDDETSFLCHWHLPQTHPFEAWGDLRAFDGTATIAQPLILPLYESKSAIEVMANLLGDGRTGYEIVQATWQPQARGGNFASWWEKAVHDGVVPGSALPTVAATVQAGLEGTLPAPAPGGDLEITFRPDPSLWDGRWANNSWLQELPKPITTICWDNVAILSPETARRLQLIPNPGRDMVAQESIETDAIAFAQIQGKKLIELTVNGRQLQMPVWILPGQPDNTITAHLGYGRTRAGVVGTIRGFDTYQLRASDALHFAPVTVKDTGREYPVVYTQPHHTMRGIGEERNREIVRTGTLAEYLEKDGEILEHVHVPEALVPTGYGTRPEGLEPRPGAPQPEGGHGEVGETHGAGDVEAGGAHGGGHGGGHGESPIQPSHGFTRGRVVGETPEQGKEAYADPVRKSWRYAEKSVSNKEGWPSLYPEYSNKGFNAWAMSIDLTLCIGCNACVIACQAENNIPTVGKEQVGMGREMHWLRIDHYYAAEDSWDKVESYFQPVACVHCEKAPCEPVCPVAATIHSHEGLNQMIYNRCIGTRYCSNNCPYKVRRFNFLKWVEGAGGPGTLNYYDRPQLRMMTNPDVTLRGRGVMEKCTYCVQRINKVRIEAKKDGREIQDGEVITACQQVCPTQTIVFGDLNNPNSQVRQLRDQPHDYALLADLNTRPRTTYLARIKNLNPEIVALTPTEVPALEPPAMGAPANRPTTGQPATGQPATGQPATGAPGTGGEG